MRVLEILKSENKNIRNHADFCVKVLNRDNIVDFESFITNDFGYKRPRKEISSPQVQF